MGCGGSKPLARHADDRELDELDISMTKVGEVDAKLEVWSLRTPMLVHCAADG